jgi:hypothetical protein
MNVSPVSAAVIVIEINFFWGGGGFFEGALTTVKFSALLQGSRNKKAKFYTPRTLT